MVSLFWRTSRICLPAESRFSSHDEILDLLCDCGVQGAPLPSPHRAVRHLRRSESSGYGELRGRPAAARALLPQLVEQGARAHQAASDQSVIATRQQLLFFSVSVFMDLSYAVQRPEPSSSTCPTTPALALACLLLQDYCVHIRLCVCPTPHPDKIRVWCRTVDEEVRGAKGG